LGVKVFFFVTTRWGNAINLSLAGVAPCPRPALAEMIERCQNVAGMARSYGASFLESMAVMRCAGTGTNIKFSRNMC